MEIPLPALCERREDIPLLAAHFLNEYAKRYRKRLVGFAADAMQAMLAHSWPGNVREIDHAIERAVLLAEGAEIRSVDLALGPVVTDGAPALEDMTLDEVERHLIQRALTRFDGNVSEAARALGLSRSALYRRLQRFGL